MVAITWPKETCSMSGVCQKIRQAQTTLRQQHQATVGTQVAVLLMADRSTEAERGQNEGLPTWRSMPTCEGRLGRHCTHERHGYAQRAEGHPQASTRPTWSNAKTMLRACAAKGPLCQRRRRRSWPALPSPAPPNCRRRRRTGAGPSARRQQRRLEGTGWPAATAAHQTGKGHVPRRLRPPRSPLQSTTTQERWHRRLPRSSAPTRVQQRATPNHPTGLRI